VTDRQTDRRQTVAIPLAGVERKRNLEGCGLVLLSFIELFFAKLILNDLLGTT